MSFLLIRDRFILEMERRILDLGGKELEKKKE